MLKIPRFFHFQLNEDGSDYVTTHLMENTTYIWTNAYWDDLMVTGFVPLLILIYFNFRIYLRVSKNVVHEKQRRRSPKNLINVLIFYKNQIGVDARKTCGNIEVHAFLKHHKFNKGVSFVIYVTFCSLNLLSFCHETYIFKVLERPSILCSCLFYSYEDKQFS